MELWHYGVGILDGAPGRGSGRFPRGSGENPYQHGAQDFIERIESLRNDGMSEKDIAAYFGLSTTKFRSWESIAKNERRAQQVATAKRLSEEGYSTTDIGRMMGKNESTVRSYLNSESENRMNKAQSTADFLKSRLDETGGVLDVGAGVELELNISKNKLQDAITILESQGYQEYNIRVEQLTNPGRYTTLRLLCPPGMQYPDVYKAKDAGDIHSVVDYYSPDGGATFKSNVMQPPANLDSNRVMIRYKEDGGSEKDGVVELRRGVDDISLGDSNYAQVRIAVDGTHYIKGMAMYSDNMPDGVDVIFNTNKSNTVPKMEVLKKLNDDPQNPFGALIKANGQSTYIGKDGKEHLRVINKVREEGEWNEWSDSLSAQFLSKQPIPLVKKQLTKALDDKKQEFNDICALTNPTIKRHYLQAFADECEYDSVHLQAASLPRQKFQVILPVKSLNDTEIYAPNYNNGEKVALVRYPHGGTFEIPILTVNNKHAEGKRVLGQAKDAVGINKNVADRLSGADFDGDTVMVIPISDKVRIKSTHPLKGLEGFDTKEAYGPDKVETDDKGNEHYFRNGREYRIMSKAQTQNEMGRISNLITDMTIKGANEDELARAVSHSMVVIDANKHHLDYRASEITNDIDELKRKYQKRVDSDGNEKYGGASTLISRAKSEVRIPERKGNPRINKETGELEYKNSGRTYVDKQGRTQLAMETTTQMAIAKDARTLSSGYEVENVYADYANSLKAMANTARKEELSTPRLTYQSSARSTYSKEVDSLTSKLNTSLKGAPKERMAQYLGGNAAKAKRESNPSMTKPEFKKVKQQCLTYAREQLNAKRTEIEITDSEWDAIQAGAISDTQLTRILRYADADKLRERAMPFDNSLSKAQISKIKSLDASGYTQGEIARALGVSISTVSNYL